MEGGPGFRPVTPDTFEYPFTVPIPIIRRESDRPEEWYDDGVLDRDDALAAAKHLDLSRKAYGVSVQIKDMQWGNIANDFVDSMGFTEASGKPR